MKLSRLTWALLVVVACVVLAGAALASKGSGPARKLHNPTRVHSLSTKQDPNEQAAESESSTDQEAGQGEPAQGHADPAGQDVNHECSGDCQE